MIGLLADYVLKTAVVFALAGGAALLLRNHSAAVRHAVWSAALAIALLLGPLAFVTPWFGVPLYPRATAASGGSGALASFPGRAVEDAKSVSAPSPEADRSARASAARPGGLLADTVRRLPAISLAIWLVGALLGLARIAGSRWRLGQFRRRGTPITGASFGHLARDVQRRLGLTGRDVEFLSSRALRTPVAFGAFRPTVMLPIEACSWDSGRLRIVLTHELSHVRRRDALTQLVAELARAVHWYNPLAWYAAGRLSVERERACDDEVVEDGAPGLDYAELLLALAKRAAGEPRGPQQVLTIAERSGLEGRIGALLGSTVRRERLTAVQRGLIGAHAVLAMAALVLVGGVSYDATARDETVMRRPAGLSAREVPAPARPVPAPHASGADVPEPAQPARSQPASVPKADDSLDDPRSELVVIARGARGPTQEEVRTSAERELIERLQAAATHEKTSESDLVRERSQWALTRVRDGEIVAPLIVALADRDWRVQASAAWSLAAIDAQDAAPTLRGLLRHANWRVRAQATSALLGLGHSLPLEGLQTLAHDSAWQVRMDAVEFLRRDGGPGAAAMLDAMKDDPHGGVRMQVLSAQSEIGIR